MILKFYLMDHIYFVHGDWQLVPTCIGTIAVISRTPLPDTLNQAKLSFQNSMSQNNQAKTRLPCRLTLGEELVCELYGWWRHATR